MCDCGAGGCSWWWVVFSDRRTTGVAAVVGHIPRVPVRAAHGSVAVLGRRAILVGVKPRSHQSPGENYETAEDGGQRCDTISSVLPACVPNHRLPPAHIWQLGAQQATLMPYCVACALTACLPWCCLACVIDVSAPQEELSGGDADDVNASELGSACRCNGKGTTRTYELASPTLSDSYADSGVRVRTRERNVAWLCLLLQLARQCPIHAERARHCGIPGPDMRVLLLGYYVPSGSARKRKRQLGNKRRWSTKQSIELSAV
jgi:hypothetical protein